MKFSFKVNPSTKKTTGTSPADELVFWYGMFAPKGRSVGTTALAVGLRLLLAVYILSSAFWFTPQDSFAYGHENVCDHYTEHTASGGFADYQSHDYTNGLLNIHLKFNVQARGHTQFMVLSIQLRYPEQMKSSVPYASNH